MAGEMTISIDARQLHRAMKQAPFKVKVGMTAWVARTALRTEREEKQDIRPHVDTGELQSSVHTFLNGLSAEVKPTSKHAIFVHEGRRPGRMPPFGPNTSLGSWARRKGMNAFLVARSIGKRGIKPYRYVDRAYSNVKPVAERDASQTLDQIVRSI